MHAIELRSMLRSFHWDWEHEKCVEKLWPMGPVRCARNTEAWFAELSAWSLRQKGPETRR